MCTGVAPQTATHYVGHLDGVIVTIQPGWMCSLTAFNSAGILRKNLAVVSLLTTILSQFSLLFIPNSQIF